MDLTFYVLLSEIKMNSITIFNANTQYKIAKSYSELEDLICNIYMDTHLILTYVDPNSETFKKFTNELQESDFYNVKYVYSDGSIEDNIDNLDYNKEHSIRFKIKKGEVDFPNIEDFKYKDDNYEVLYEYALNKYIELLSETDLTTDIEFVKNNNSNQSVLDILRTLIFDRYKFLGNIYRVTQESYLNLWIQEMYNSFSNPIYCNKEPIKVIQEYDLNKFKDKLEKIKIDKNTVTNKDDVYLGDLYWFEDIVFHTINGYCLSISKNKISINRNTELLIPEKYNVLL